MPLWTCFVLHVCQSCLCWVDGCSQSSSSLLDDIQTVFLPTDLLHGPSLSLTVLSAYTSSSSLFFMSLLINPNCSWYHNLSLLKWFGDQGLAVSSFQLTTAMCCWFHRAIKAVWLPLDFICESKVVSLPQRRGGNEIESRIFWSYSQRKSDSGCPCILTFPYLHLSLCSLQNTRYIYIFNILSLVFKE